MRLNFRGGLLAVFCVMMVTVSGDTEVVNLITSEKHVINEDIPWAVRAVSSFLYPKRTIMIAAPPLLTENVRNVCDDSPIVGSCPYECWLALPALPYGAKTLRLSWPASYPAEFSLKIFSPEELTTLIRERWPIPHEEDQIDPRHKTQYVYARVLAKSRGIRPPNSGVPNSQPLEVPVNIVYEPLVLGFLPLSLLPTVWITVGVAIVAAFCVQPITAFLDKIAGPLRKDLPPVKED